MMKSSWRAFSWMGLVTETFRLKRLGTHRFQRAGVAEGELIVSGRLRDRAV
jgi:hypothetical protein